MSLLLGDLIGLTRRHTPISLPLLPSIMQLYFGWGLRLAWSFACRHYGYAGGLLFQLARGIDHDLRQH
jgi:hypothetical protein